MRDLCMSSDRQIVPLPRCSSATPESARSGLGSGLAILTIGRPTGTDHSIEVLGQAFDFPAHDRVVKVVKRKTRDVRFFRSSIDLQQLY